MLGVATFRVLVTVVYEEEVHVLDACIRIKVLSVFSTHVEGLVRLRDVKNERS